MGNEARDNCLPTLYDAYIMPDIAAFTRRAHTIDTNPTDARASSNTDRNIGNRSRIYCEKLGLGLSFYLRDSVNGSQQGDSCQDFLWVGVGGGGTLQVFEHCLECL